MNYNIEPFDISDKNIVLNNLKSIGTVDVLVKINFYLFIIYYFFFFIFLILLMKTQINSKYKFIIIIILFFYPIYIDYIEKLIMVQYNIIVNNLQNKTID
jgi:hypothetical protein